MIIYNFYKLLSGIVKCNNHQYQVVFFLLKLGRPLCVFFTTVYPFFIFCFFIVRFQSHCSHFFVSRLYPNLLSLRLEGEETNAVGSVGLLTEKFSTVSIVTTSNGRTSLFREVCSKNQNCQFKLKFGI